MTVILFTISPSEVTRLASQVAFVFKVFPISNSLPAQIISKERSPSFLVYWLVEYNYRSEARLVFMNVVILHFLEI
jgi:hypothetical protein